MSKLIDLTSQRFGRLVVLEKAPPTGGQAEWICKCDCGNIKKVKAVICEMALFNRVGVLIRNAYQAVGRSTCLVKGSVNSV